MREKGLVVISGCSSGIGRALAREYLRAGYPVLATARDPGTIADLEGADKAALDVAEPASVAALGKALAARGEKVAVLVNNAGYGAMGPLAEMPLAELRRQFEVNVVGAMALTQAAFPLMGAGSLVINVGSVSGDFPTPFAGAYCASKAALHSLTDSLRAELAPFGVDVLSARPGGIASRFGETAGKGAFVPGPGSRYLHFAAGIRARANESQSRAAGAEAFARLLVRESGKKRRRALLRFGPRSRALVLIKALLPRGTVDSMVMKKYGLKE